MILLLGMIAFVSLLLSAGCSTAELKDTIKSHRLLIRPGTNIVPRPVDDFDGEEPVQEDYKTNGDTFMLIFRGRI